MDNMDFVLNFCLWYKLNKFNWKEEDETKQHHHVERKNPNKVMHGIR